MAIPTRILAMFASEAQNRCAELVSLLPRLAEGGEAAWKEAARHVHTIKGTARVVGVAGVAELAADIEGSIEGLRTSAEGLSSAEEARLGGVVEEIRVLVARLEEDLAGPERS